MRLHSGIFTPYLPDQAHLIFPEASPWSDHEMLEWQTLFHAIMRMAKERAIDTTSYRSIYLSPKNLHSTPGSAGQSGTSFLCQGDTSAIIKQYTRECITQLLDEYPDLTGLGLTLAKAWAA